jgi:hypothetical protein
MDMAEPGNRGALASECAGRDSNSRLVQTPVAVEKVVFFKNRLKLGDRKCLPDPRRSFIAHPDAFYFCEFCEKEFFNSHP